MEQIESIKWVTGGFTLAAFVVAVIATVIRATLSRDRDVLSTISGSESEVRARERVATELLERFHVDTAGMASRDKMKLAVKQLEERRKRLGLLVWLAAFVIAAAGTVTVVALRRAPAANPHGSTELRKPQEVRAPAAVKPATPGSVSANHGIAGGGDVQITNSTVNIGDSRSPQGSGSPDRN